MKDQQLVGRKQTFNTPRELQAKIDDYFKRGVTTRQIVVGSGKTKRIETIPIPTITGLMLHCGFESRLSFYDYEKRGEFSYTIKRARLLIEQVYEEQLQTGTPTGAIFALKNFGWRDQQQLVVQETQEDISELSDEELNAQIDRHLEKTHHVKLADIKAFRATQKQKTGSS